MRGLPFSGLAVLPAGAGEDFGGFFFTSVSMESRKELRSSSFFAGVGFASCFFTSSSFLGGGGGAASRLTVSSSGLGAAAEVTTSVGSSSTAASSSFGASATTGAMSVTSPIVISSSGITIIGVDGSGGSTCSEDAHRPATTTPACATREKNALNRISPVSLPVQGCGWRHWRRPAGRRS